MTQWLVDTFIWTGALIALVLVLRRPVARHFGPQVAYALWALPLLRLLLPPLVLPASMAPAQNFSGAAMAADMPVAAMPISAASLEAAPGSAFDWTLLLAALWLGGAFLLLGWRYAQYQAMRADLLSDARPVGEAGRVRLVETPAVRAPVAFGVFDKVVALPPGFMAQPDRAARDLAIAHELAHHRGHDLLANIAAQPLLALHWFNPLAWAGWRAMRRDQEAACDARVIAGCDRDERVTYARVIAGYATGRPMGLAAPMAGPLKGEKSIIHRLRTLTMADVSAARRKWGLGAIAGSALLALPLTASITYAQPEAPEAPIAPDAPEAPAAPEAPQVTRRVVIVEGTDGSAKSDADLHEQARRDLEEADREVAQAMADTRRAMADNSAAMADHREALADQRRALAESRRAIAQARADLPRIEQACEGDQTVTERVDADGRKVIVMCQRNVRVSASNGLREAQRAIRSAPGIPESERREILRDLQEQIEELEREELSFAVPPVAPVAVPAAVAPVAYPVRSVRVRVKAPRVPAAPDAPAAPAAPAAPQAMPVAIWLSGGTVVFGTVAS
ncbi:M56 family metallopeptidase [Alteraurantiacibacter buctensis]|uniref:M56 family metallopeptidase n=1 Tax=Alteraurantiacibacter buctensis TaxID=1503981 RepID=UPI001F375C25|nr:M56 family metallopeptidase [Alteraurantiacibacter buctensis]